MTFNSPHPGSVERGRLWLAPIGFKERLIAAGMLTGEQIAAQLGVLRQSVRFTCGGSLLTSTPLALLASV